MATASARGAARKAKRALVYEKHLVAYDTRRGLRNLRASGKLIALTLASSALMGVAGWVFLSALAWVTATREANPALFLLLPATGALTVYVYRRWGRNAGRGNNLVIEAAVRNEHVPARMAPLILVSTLATHLTGGSAGREGTAVQMGGSIAGVIGERARLAPRDRETLVLTGISAAFGAVFGTPLAGTFFGLEMCFVGKLEYRALLYCLVASFTGNGVAQALGVRHGAHAIASVPEPTVRMLLVVGGAAVLFGIAARAFLWLLRHVKRFYAHRFTSPVVAAAVGGAVACAFFVPLGLERFGGLSEWLVAAGFAGETTLADAALKLVGTCLTLGSGLQGGEVTPLFGIGASLGGWLGGALRIEPSFLAAIGMVAVFGSAANAPLTTIMLGVDMFGGDGALYFVLAAFISYYVAGHHGLYPAQVIATPKRRTLMDEEGMSLDEALAHHDELVAEGASDTESDDAPANTDIPSFKE